MPNQAALFALSEKAKLYGVNPDRPFFPVNSLRLLYFMILDELTNSTAAREKMSELIPKIEAVLAARNKGKIATSLESDKDYQRAAGPLQDLLQTFNTPVIEALIGQLFGVTLPHQDSQLLLLYTQMENMQLISPQLLLSLLQIRSVDSLLYSTYMLELFHKAGALEIEMDAAQKQRLALFLHSATFLSYQMNDLVDMVVFAKDDMETDSPTPLKYLQHTVQDPQMLKSLVADAAESLLGQMKSLSFDHPIHSVFLNYNSVLYSVIH